jgi:predicted lipoprotein with Yx(FWY)xxD motif
MHRPIGRLAAGLIPLMFVLGACSGGTPVETVAPTPVPTQASQPSATPGTTATPAPSTAASSDTLVTATVGSLGTVVVAGNGMTVYTFVNDVKDSGKSNCTGGCLTTWPAVTVPAGATPTAGAGVTGTLATFVRTDDGTTQVTYNGLPLYFFSGDAKPGDGNGVYKNWEAVAP